MLLDMSKPGTLHGQVFEAVRTKIIHGELAEGSRLPSSRTMARELCVSRNVILAAYENLRAEGYLESRHGSGTFVAMPPDAFLKPPRQSNEASSNDNNQVKLSEFGNRVSKISSEMLPGASHAPSTIRFNFRWGIPAVDLLPGQWQKIVRKRASAGSLGEMGYGDPQGSVALREQLAKHVLAYRGIKCDVEDILIVNGSQQGIDLAARMLVNVDDAVAVEDPCYPGIKHIFQSVGAKNIPISVDREGMRVEDLVSCDLSAKLVCVTPSYQYPSGSVMSHERRLQLIEYAKQRDAVILEDDYDSEFRFDTRPERALFSFDPNGRTVYVGTFSKQLFPALRIGYLILPKSLKTAFLTAKMVADRHAPTLMQDIVSEFMAEGYLARHLRRVRAEIVERRTQTIEVLEHLFGDDVEICGGDAGTHLLVWFKGIRAERVPQIVKRALALGVGIYPASACYSRPLEAACFVIGYASLTPKNIAEGLQRLSTAIDDCSKSASLTVGKIGATSQYAVA